MASQYDPEGERTVGVITKCDATQHVSQVSIPFLDWPDEHLVDHRQVLERAQNEEKHLRHGWFVVRNRTPAEVEANVDSQDRERREESFFEQLPWNTLPKLRRGVQALKKYLADLLCTRIQMGFPLMLETLQSRRLLTTSKLEALGQPRVSIEHKTAYLSTIAHNFHLQASAALHGRYGAIKNEKLKLRKAVRDANDKFMQEIKANGHLVPFSELPSVEGMMSEVKGQDHKISGSAAAEIRAGSWDLHEETYENYDDYEEPFESEDEVQPNKVWSWPCRNE